jgi:integrase
MPVVKKARIKLIKPTVKGLKEPGFYRDSELIGFGIKVTDGGKKVYFAESSVKGTRQVVRVTIGGNDKYDPDEARSLARQYLAMLAEGINPNEQKQKEKAAQTAMRVIEELTLSKVFHDYKVSRQNLKAKTLSDYERLLKRCVGDWFDKPVVEITKEMIETRHRKLSEHPAQADLTMRIVRALFTYAGLTYEDSEGRSLVQANPVKRLSQAKTWNKVKPREEYLKPHQLKVWYNAVQHLDVTMRDYLMLCVLTGLRRNEATTLKWRDVDFEHETLTVRDTKNHLDHTLPLSTFLFALLKRRELSKENDFVFPGKGRYEHLVEPRRATESIERNHGIKFRIHDLRRTFVTTAESLDIPYLVVKRLVNHKQSGDVTAGYVIANVDRLREPMRLISNHILKNCGLSEAEIHPPKPAQAKLRLVR